MEPSLPPHASRLTGSIQDAVTDRCLVHDDDKNINAAEWFLSKTLRPVNWSREEEALDNKQMSFGPELNLTPCALLELCEIKQKY